MTSPLQLAPVPTSIDNREDWEPITEQITRQTALPVAITPESVVAIVRGAVSLMFEAHVSGDANVLRGTFADPVVAQCQRNIDSLLAGQPASATVHLVGGRVTGGHPTVRVHVVIRSQSPDGAATVDRQFWDLQLGDHVTIAQTTCPNCGAPLGHGELICDHCHADVRNTVEVPVAVSRLELY